VEPLGFHVLGVDNGASGMSRCDRCPRTATEIVGMEQLCSKDAILTRARKRESYEEGIDLVVAGPHSGLSILTDTDGAPYAVIDNRNGDRWKVIPNAE
jgi:hypothetical protein